MLFSQVRQYVKGLLNEYHQTILPYLSGNSMVACGGGYAPIGTVIAYMGTRAPSDFLICDGTIYNIADYTELADFFEAQFGSNNFFGGDGATTFAVPDLRGEFLRGTGTNSHTNQGSGANVGVHQDGTSVPIAMTDNSNMNIAYGDGSISETILDTVFHVDAKTERGSFRQIQGTSQSYENDARTKNFTSRPTNTSVLYCIKAKSQGNGYSLDEQIVGTWIDGKPIYQKTIELNNPSKGVRNQIGFNISGIKTISLYAIFSTGNVVMPYYYQSKDYFVVELGGDKTSLWVDWASEVGTCLKIVATLQYTKTT